jgi:anti-sigma regulatory factor (Ser/Thr protein kinase)
MASDKGRQRSADAGDGMSRAMAGPGPHEAAIRGDPDELPALMAFVGAAGRAMGLAEADRLRLELVVEELATNSLTHSAAPRGLPLELRLERQGDVVRIDYADRGRAFDPADLPDAWPRGAAGGFGWRLIRRYCPELAYRREGVCNRLTLGLRLLG